MKNPKERVLKKAEAIQGTTFQPGTSIRLDDEGNLERVELGADQQVADVNFAASMPWVFKKGTTLQYQGIIFKAPQVPSKITIHEPMTIWGIDFPAETCFEPASAAGSIGDEGVNVIMFMQAQLGEATTIKGKEFPAYEYIQFYADGKVIYRENGEEKEL
ncbi:MAG: hypothetical protein Q6373_020260 [Candidatus Sigynarchaeota archaeon]